jgi:putative transposase
VPDGFRLVAGGLRIPKIAPIPFVLHRPLEGTPRQVTISRTPAGRYYASILCAVEVPDPDVTAKATQPEIGLDLGVKDFAVLSTGEKIPTPKHLRRAEKRLKRLQRRLSRRQIGSNGREKARRALASQHEKVANRRKDFQHKLSARLTRETQAVYVEDLAVKNLLRNHHLAKSISDAGWGEFLRQLAYKGTWRGCRVQAIGRFVSSSKQCSVCRYTLDELPHRVRAWVCPNCGTTHDRDINAARNIFRVGQGAFLEQQHTAGTAGMSTPTESLDADSLKSEAASGQ